MRPTTNKYLPYSYRTLAFRYLALVMAAMLSSCAQEPEPSPGRNNADVMASPDLATTGRQLYETYCASCHGLEARGDGPVASLLTIPPPDLTQIRTRNEGAFPVDDLYRMIDGREEVPAHGSREMPVWGNAWETMDSSTMQSPQSVEERINLLIEYLRSIQTENEG